MANYLLQPDGSGTCCDCPDRESPCDDCGSGSGACCIDDTCSILSADDCASAGGTYQGDDTICEHGRCVDCCYPAFDGSGRTFNTQTVVLTGYSDTIGAPSCESTVSATGIKNCDGSCTCSGSSDRPAGHSVGECHETNNVCVAVTFDPYSPSDWTTPRTAPTVAGCNNTNPFGCGSCCSFTLSLSSDSPTVRVFDTVPTGSCGSGGTGTVTVTLSNECDTGLAPTPSLFQKARNLVSAAGRVTQAAASGQAITSSREEIKRRLEICEGCEFYKNGTCQKCGCVIRFKTKLATEKCPLGKW